MLAECVKFNKYFFFKLRIKLKRGFWVLSQIHRILQFELYFLSAKKQGKNFKQKKLRIAN